MTNHGRDSIFSNRGLQPSPVLMPWAAIAVASSPDHVEFLCGVLRR
jgi:hypothetical protein